MSLKSKNLEIAIKSTKDLEKLNLDTFTNLRLIVSQDLRFDEAILPTFEIPESFSAKNLINLEIISNAHLNLNELYKTTPNLESLKIKGHVCEKIISVEDAWNTLNRAFFADVARFGVFIGWNTFKLNEKLNNLELINAVFNAENDLKAPDSLIRFFYCVERSLVPFPRSLNHHKIGFYARGLECLMLQYNGFQFPLDVSFLIHGFEELKEIKINGNWANIILCKDLVNLKIVECFTESQYCKIVNETDNLSEKHYTFPTTHKNFSKLLDLINYFVLSYKRKFANKFLKQEMLTVYHLKYFDDRLVNETQNRPHLPKLKFLAVYLSSISTSFLLSLNTTILYVTLLLLPPLFLLKVLFSLLGTI